MLPICYNPAPGHSCPDDDGIPVPIDDPSPLWSGPGVGPLVVGSGMGPWRSRIRRGPVEQSVSGGRVRPPMAWLTVLLGRPGETDCGSHRSTCSRPGTGTAPSPGCPFKDEGTVGSHSVTGGRVMVGSPPVQWSMTTLGTRPSPDLPHRRQGRDVGGRLQKADGPILLRVGPRRGSPGTHVWPGAPRTAVHEGSGVPGLHGPDATRPGLAHYAVRPDGSHCGVSPAMASRRVTDTAQRLLAPRSSMPPTLVSGIRFFRRPSSPVTPLRASLAERSMVHLDP